MNKKTLLTFLLVFLFILANVAGCSPKSEVKTNQTTLKIGTMPLEDNLPILIAEKNGYFAQENLKVDLTPFQSPVELQSAFQSGQLDGMVTDMLIAAMLKSSGEDLRISSLTLGATPEEGRFAIVASPKSNIKTVPDLKGKSIGISSNSIIEYVTDGLLTAGGVKPSEVNKTTVAKLPVRVEMLLNNQIDAITVPDPQITYTVAKGAKIIAEDTKGDNLSQAVIIMRGKSLNEKKDAVKGFYKAYAKAVDDINKSPEQFKDLLVKDANIPADIAANYRIQHYSKPQLPAEKEVNSVLKWLKDKNLLKSEVTYDSFIVKDLY
ncbi:MAG: ABC transporter substrate-binding protein [Peptococcaceae bacterium]|nr:ABC transporter substrate-binding protein [Peptococcaceae bacterium]